MANLSILAVLEENSRIIIPRGWEREILPESGRIVFKGLAWEQLDYLIEILRKASRGNGFKMSLQRNTVSVHCLCDHNDDYCEILMTAQIWDNRFHATLQLIR